MIVKLFSAEESSATSKKGGPECQVSDTALNGTRQRVLELLTFRAAHHEMSKRSADGYAVALLSVVVTNERK